MLTSRIILLKPISLDQDYEITEEAFQSLCLWKPRLGEIITVQDISGQGFRARVTWLSGSSAQIKVFAAQELGKGLEIMLHQALPERERLEWILQKATELGVHTIIPFISERSVTLEEREKKQKKAHRWPDLILKAAKQCRRPDIPHLVCGCTFHESLYLAQQSQLRLLLWEKSIDTSKLEDLLPQNPEVSRISIMIGPEGGFTEDEVNLAKKSGFQTVHLGPRIFRTETASLIILSIIQFILGDLN